MGAFLWRVFIEALGAAWVGSTSAQIVLGNVQYFEALAQLLSSLPPRAYAEYLRWRFIDALVQHLGTERSFLFIARSAHNNGRTNNGCSRAHSE